MDNTTIILPSARAIRHEQLQLQETTLFLPNYMTMSDFISRLCIVDGYKFIDEDSRVLLLLEASEFEGFASLQIERNFFTFTKNSSYIFKFFEELSAELYDISNLSGIDVYGEFDEHIEILQELYKRYEALCESKKLLDRVFLPKLYKFNSSFAKLNPKIRLKIVGHLTNFEFELLQKCSEHSTISIVFQTSAFNSKMQSKFAELGIELEAGYEYEISLNERTIVSKEKIIKNKNIQCESLSESLLQVAFVKQKIYEFMKKGYEAHNIAVVLPDEKMAGALKSFDTKANLNFAMGESFSKSRLYTKLNATMKYIEQDSKENAARCERVGDELYMTLRTIYSKKACDFDLIALLSEIKEHFKNKIELKIYEEEVHMFKKMITVMGVLETRSVSFDGVIIVDFDDKNVPKRSDKDMFLNSAIRENAALPTMSDRENLQKHYYEMLINSSKEVAISFINSSESGASRFLKQLKIKEKNVYDEVEYANILFKRSKQEQNAEIDIVQDYSFKDVKLSATGLKIFLTCKRRYYHKYVERIKAHDIPKDMPKEYEIGNAVHEALKELYLKKRSYSDAQELQRDLEKELDRVCGDSELDKYLIAIQKKRLAIFAKKELNRFNDGWEVHRCEESFSIPYEGMTLNGQIDRIDKRKNEIEVLDYKTGSYTLYTKNSYHDATDFQLEFYFLGASGFGDVMDCGFYDLKNSEIVPEAFMQEKLDILKSHIKDLLMIQEVNFTKCEDTKACSFCEFAIMCGRD